MERSLREAAERVRNLLRSNRARLRGSFSAQQFRHEGRTCQRRDATARAESGLRDAPRLHADGNLEDVAADGIFHGYRGGGRVERARISRILKMIEDCFAVHG